LINENRRISNPTQAGRSILISAVSAGGGLGLPAIASRSGEAGGCSIFKCLYVGWPHKRYEVEVTAQAVSTITSCDGRLQQAKNACKGKGDQKTPHRLFQADGGLKEGNGIGEPYTHLADI